MTDSANSGLSQITEADLRSAAGPRPAPRRTVPMLSGSRCRAGPASILPIQGACHAQKKEDADERWYADWIAFQARHHVYARLLSPRHYSNVGGEMDLLRLGRFLDRFAYFSPAHPPHRGTSGVPGTGFSEILKTARGSLKGSFRARNPLVGALSLDTVSAAGEGNQGHQRKLLLPGDLFIDNCSNGSQFIRRHSTDPLTKLIQLTGVDDDCMTVEMTERAGGWICDLY